MTFYEITRLLFLPQNRICLTLFWMRTSWRMHVNTWQSIWKPIGGQHTCLSALLWTLFWAGTWAPLHCLHIQQPSLDYRWETLFSICQVQHEADSDACCLYRCAFNRAKEIKTAITSATTLQWRGTVWWPQMRTTTTMNGKKRAIIAYPPAPSKVVTTTRW